MLRRPSAVVALAVIASLTSFSGVTGATPSLSMTGFSPLSGPVGTMVTIAGSGFRSNDIVRFNGTAAPSSKANAAGTTLKVGVPAFATSGPITVTDPRTGHRAGLPGTAFAVTRGIGATARVWRGGQVIVSGSALSPNQRDGIRIGDTLVGTALTNANGDFQIGVTVPFDQTSGRIPITVLDTGGNVLKVILVLADWPQDRHDELGTGNQTFELWLSTTTAPSLTQHWAVDCCTSTGVTVANGMAFMGLDSHLLFYSFAALYADKLATGAQAWQFITAYYDRVSQTPTVADGVVYDTDWFGSLFALDAKTGTELWAAQLPTGTGLGSGSSPTVANGVVYIDSPGRLNAIDATNGGLLWSHQPGTSTGLGSAPAVLIGGSVAGGEVIAGETDGNLYAYVASTGALLWSKPGGGASKPAIVGGNVYMGSSNGTIYARNVSTGALVWKYATGGAVYPPAVAGSTVFASSAGGNLYALNAATGAVLWAKAMNPGTAPAVANGVVYFGRTDGKVQALNASNGVGLGNVTPANPQLDSRGPIVANGVVYFTTSFDGNVTNGTYDPTLYAYGL